MSQQQRAEPGLTGAWRAPGRLNLIGEHTDYTGGLALPIALDRSARVRLTVLEPGERDRLPSPYLEGVVWVLRRQGYDVPPLAAELDSDVPIGAGLSSSAALTCATALGVSELVQLGLGREELVVVAQRAENDFVGAPTGSLDQSASLLCTAGHALAIDFGAGTHRQVPCELGEARLLVVDTKVHHTHSDSGYGERRRECEEAARLLGIPDLGAATARDIESLPEPLRRRARHQVTENQRVREVVAHLDTGPATPAVGRLLVAGHASLRDDFEVSAPELDLVVDTAMAAGAWGARMTGGGFGGSALVLTPEPGHAERSVRAAFGAQGLEEPDVFEVRPGEGARRLA